MNPFNAIVELVRLIPPTQRRGPALIGMAIVGTTVVTGGVATVLGPVTAAIKALGQ